MNLNALKKDSMKHVCRVTCFQTYKKKDTQLNSGYRQQTEPV